MSASSPAPASASPSKEVSAAVDDSLKRAKPAGGARRGGGEELALTQPDSSVMSRIALASVRHNPRSAGPAGLRGFQCGEMQPGEFSEQLKRAFGIRLTPQELDEAVDHFDADGGGTIDGAEFLVHFFQMGFAEKAAQKRARDARGRALREEQLELARSKEQKAQSFLDAQVDWDFKPSDKRSALRKLTAASLAFAQGGLRVTGAGGLRGFQGASMPPAVLREQLKRTFSILLTKRELGALVGMVDSDGSGTIDGAEFLCFFLKIGREESNRLARLGKRGAVRRALLREVAAKEAAEDEEMRESAVMARFGPDDEASALRKVSTAAVNYNRNALGPAKLRGFQDSAAMKPDMFARALPLFSPLGDEAQAPFLRFARQLFTTFGVKLSRRELAALAHKWDGDGDGTIDSTEFMVQFFRFKSRSRVQPGQQRPSTRELYGACGGGGWTAAMPPLGRPVSTSALFRAAGGTGRLPPRGGTARAGTALPSVLSSSWDPDEF